MSKAPWPVAKNKGGSHGGVPIGNQKLSGGFSTPGQKAGNPGVSLPWEGADSTPKSDKSPPLKSL